MTIEDKKLQLEAEKFALSKRKDLAEMSYRRDEFEREREQKHIRFLFGLVKDESLRKLC